ncbi:hypothetical protein GCM10023116_10970 [Kistimonas scapharcae]|uniref:Prepilin-type N-terminal cleavage/methylation domain-containing protein n=1 Tax=Kistimonas scapharcae TaxID=1036133 RepID=A0ABP8V071_9GAMM
MKQLQQRGLSLVELMVAMVVGLVLMAGLLTLYLNHHTGYTLTAAMGRAQEAGDFGLSLMARYIRMAGFNPDQPTSTAVDTTLSTNGAVSDTLAITFIPVDDQHCTGTSSDTVTNIFFVQDNTLRCQDSDGNTQTLATGIENLQVQYGVDQDSDGQIDRYQTAPDGNALSIRLGLLANAGPSAALSSRNRSYNVLDETITHNADSTLRRIFTTTIYLANTR